MKIFICTRGNEIKILNDLAVLALPAKQLKNFKTKPTNVENLLKKKPTF